jgi:uncharacterized repeat protein (TIGR03943 family)
VSARLRPATVVAALIATVLLRISLSGEFRSYVQSSMRIPLIVSGVLLAVMALLDVTGKLSTLPDHEGHEDHGHGEARISWLLVAPVLALLVVIPPPLGTWSAARQQNRATPGLTWSPLTTVPGEPVAMPVLDFVGRSLDANAGTVREIDVALVGFVGEQSTDGFTLVRFSIACCAADGLASSVRVVGASATDDATGKGLVTGSDLVWVNVVGRYESTDGLVPVVRATRVSVVPQPQDPYE